MIRYSQAPKNLKNAVSDSYSEEEVQEQKKDQDKGNPLEGKTEVDDD